MLDPRAAQCIGGSGEGGPRGDHVVDQQHPQPATRWPPPITGAVETLLPGTAGLGLAVGAVQQPAARHAEVASHRPSQQLCLVETATTFPHTTGGCPCHDVDQTGAPGTHELCGQRTGHIAVVAVLQAQQHLTRHPLEGHRSHDVATGSHR